MDKYYCIFSRQGMMMIPQIFVTADPAEAEAVRAALVARGETPAVVESAAQAPADWLRSPRNGGIG